MIKLDVNGTIFNAQMCIITDKSVYTDCVETDLSWERGVEKELKADGFLHTGSGTWIVNMVRLLKIDIDGMEYAKKKNGLDEKTTGGANHYVCSVLKAE